MTLKYHEELFNKYFRVGTIVKPTGSYGAFRSGGEAYGCAVIVSVYPLILLSERGDMQWSCMTHDEFSAVSHVLMADPVVLNTIMKNRLYEDRPLYLGHDIKDFTDRIDGARFKFKTEPFLLPLPLEGEVGSFVVLNEQVGADYTLLSRVDIGDVEPITYIYFRGPDNKLQPSHWLLRYNKEHKAHYDQENNLAVDGADGNVEASQAA